MNPVLIGIGEASRSSTEASGARAAVPPALDLANRAAEACLRDAGLQRSVIDGVISYGLFGDIVPAEAVGTSLGADLLHVALDLNLGGQAPALAVGLAADYVRSGRANAVLVVRSLLGRSGLRVGSARFPRLGEDERQAAGVSAYPITAALWAQAYLEAAQLDSTALFQAWNHAQARRWSAKQTTELDIADFAPRTPPASRAAYFESPMIADPLRRDDCVSEVDGAAAILVVSEDLAQDTHSIPLAVTYSTWRSIQPDVDMGSVLGVEDLSRNVAWHLARDVRERADLRPADCDVVSLYDCFSSVLMQNLEGIGLCDFGGAPEFLEAASRNAPRPAAPPTTGPWLNPGGGMLARGYVHGMNNVVDAVRALRLKTQLSRGVVQGLVVSGGMTSGSAVVFRSM